MTILDQLLEMRHSPMLMAPEKCQQFFTAIERLHSGKIEKRADIMDFIFGPAVAESTSNDGVSIIPVVGTLTNRSWWTANYFDIGEKVKAAAEDDAIEHIILDIDSNGGMANGVFDLGEVIFNARSSKPITAVVSGSANSAAYLIASAATEIIIGQTSDVGSIGVVATHVDYSGFFKREGIVHTHVFSGRHKVDGSPYAPLSDEVMEQMQAEVDDIYAMFTESVAKYRGLSVDAVAGTEAQIYIGQKAIDIGLADSIASYSDAVSGILTSSNQGDRPMNTLAAPQKGDLQQSADLPGGQPNLNHKETAKEMALIAESCEQAGVSYLTAGFIRDGSSMEDVQGRLSEIEKIRTACALPHDDKTMSKKLSDTYIKQGLSLEEVQGKLIDRLANEDDSTSIDSSSKPDQRQLDDNSKGIAAMWAQSLTKTGAKFKTA